MQRRVGRGIGVGVLVFLAFMAKQDTLIAAAPVLALLIVTKRRAGAAALAAALGLVVGSTVVLNATTHDWYGYYVFDELAHQGLNGSAWTTFFTRSLLHEPWALVVGPGRARHGRLAQTTDREKRPTGCSGQLPWWAVGIVPRIPVALGWGTRCVDAGLCGDRHLRCTGL